MSVLEIEAAISKLPPSQINELAAWLERYQEKQNAIDFENGKFDDFISEAYASGEPSPLTKNDIDAARLALRTRLNARNLAK